jgi:steroid 5-alpha reductase family enzyme
VIDHRWQLWLVGWAVSALLLAALYLWQRRTRDATAVDAGWGASLVLCAILYAALAPGSPVQRLAIALPVALENLRIASLVRNRLGRGEDSRYRELRRRWREKGREQLTFAIFYQAQAFLAAVLSLPALLASFNPDSSLVAVQWAGLTLWVVAASLEWAADRQLAAFRRHPRNRGGVMDRGLWRWSRHPNYFFQTLTWVAYALIAVAAPWGWLAFLAPALILYLVLFVTGVPPAEESSLRSRGDAYRRYQARTSVFVPWPPTRSSTV